MTAASQNPHGDLAGAVLSRKYSLGRLIGQGGMGSVYEAELVAGAAAPGEMGDHFAVKVLSADFLGDADVLARFSEEGRMCQRLVHPNIVRVFDTAEAEDGTPYIVMELLDGVPLSAYTRSGGRVPLVQAATIMQGMLAGLAAAHAQGIVHRDLKPENVFLSRDKAGAFAVKILDFGIAKVMDVAGGMGHKTQTGTLLGTPAYMSPEQIKSSKDVDARADLWSAGVMLYEMLTGRIAFPAPTEYARLTAVLNATPVPVDQVDPQLSRMAPFVLHAMQKDRAQRFQTALEMARALAATMGGGDLGRGELSRLPDVPALFAPSISSVGSAVMGSMQTVSEPPRAPEPEKGPGGTLASPAGRRVSDPPPNVRIAVSPAAGTLPSEDLPMFEPVSHGRPKLPRGVAPLVVVVLVVCALVAGFLLGFASARLR